MRILLVDPAETMSVHSLSEVREITGRFAFMPNLALPTLAALAPDDVDVTIVDETVQTIDFDRQWDLVGITGYITATSIPRRAKAVTTMSRFQFR